MTIRHTRRSPSARYNTAVLNTGLVLLMIGWHLAAFSAHGTVLPGQRLFAQASDDAPLLWDPAKPVPNAKQIRPLAGVEFSVIKRREVERDGFNWLHGVALSWHDEKLYASFGLNRGAENTAGEEARGLFSTDNGRHWSALFAIDHGREADLAVSHGVFLSHQGRLWAFQGAFYGRMQRVHMRGYVMQENGGVWKPVSLQIPAGFWPMQQPQKMANGNWLIAGLGVVGGVGKGNNPATVAISHGDDLTTWDVVRVPRPESIDMWGESTVIVPIHDPAKQTGSTPQPIVCIARYRKPVALVSISRDFGRTWTPIAAANLPMTASKPYAGVLSTGQYYLIGTTVRESGNKRYPLTIAVSRPGRLPFTQIYKIRDAIQSGPGESHPQAALAYPYAVERKHKLYVGYSNSGGRGKNRNSAELAIIPIEQLRP